MIDAIVLAGGESRRMGKPKPLLRCGTQTFLERIVSVLKDSKIDRTTVVLGAQAEVVAASVDLSGTDVVINADYQEGQLSSLIAGLDHAPPETEAVLLCLGDSPFLKTETVNRVIEVFRESGAAMVIPTFQGRRGHPSLFARSMFAELKSAPLDEGARHVVHANEDRIVEVELADDAVVVGINTPDDYRRHFGTDP